MRRHFIILFLLTIYVQVVSAQDYKNEKYIDIEVLGWKVRVNERLIEGDTSLLKKSLALFGKELSAIERVLPKKSLGYIKFVPFWFEKETTTHGFTGEYWPPSSGGYLIQHGGNPAKAGGIEIVAGRYFDAKVTHADDWVILHELAHAYHYMAIQYDDRIKKVFDVILRAGLYANVRRGFDTYHHGYALTNYKEYFAELSTMYFGHNSYYPYDRADLKNYDPIGYKMIEDLWEVNRK